MPMGPKSVGELKYDAPDSANRDKDDFKMQQHVARTESKSSGIARERELQRAFEMADLEQGTAAERLEKMSKAVNDLIAHRDVMDHAAASDDAKEQQPSKDDKPAPIEQDSKASDEAKPKDDDIKSVDIQQQAAAPKDKPAEQKQAAAPAAQQAPVEDDDRASDDEHESEYPSERASKLDQPITPRARASQAWLAHAQPQNKDGMLHHLKERTSGMLHRAEDKLDEWKHSASEEVDEAAHKIDAIGADIKKRGAEWSDSVKAKGAEWQKDAELKKRELELKGAELHKDVDAKKQQLAAEGAHLKGEVVSHWTEWKDALKSGDIPPARGNDPTIVTHTDINKRGSNNAPLESRNWHRQQLQQQQQREQGTDSELPSTRAQEVDAAPISSKGSELKADWSRKGSELKDDMSRKGSELKDDVSRKSTELQRDAQTQLHTITDKAATLKDKAAAEIKEDWAIAKSKVAQLGAVVKGQADKAGVKATEIKERAGAKMDKATADIKATTANINSSSDSAEHPTYTMGWTQADEARAHRAETRSIKDDVVRQSGEWQRDAKVEMHSIGDKAIALKDKAAAEIKEDWAIAKSKVTQLGAAAKEQGSKAGAKATEIKERAGAKMDKAGAELKSSMPASTPTEQHPTYTMNWNKTDEPKWEAADSKQVQASAPGMWERISGWWKGHAPVTYQHTPAAHLQRSSSPQPAFDGRASSSDIDSMQSKLDELRAVDGSSSPSGIRQQLTNKWQHIKADARTIDHDWSNAADEASSSDMDNAPSSPRVLESSSATVAHVYSPRASARSSSPMAIAHMDFADIMDAAVEPW